MALINALMKYKQQGQITSFDMHDDNRATLHLQNGKECVVYMAEQYIVGEGDVYSAINGYPKAEFIIFNDWDNVSGAAERLAERERVPFMKFGRFAYKLDEIGA